MPSQRVLQQYGSWAQTSPAQVLHVDLSAEPWLQTAWAQVPPPPLLPLELPPLLPLELPLPELLELPLLLPLPLLDPLLLPLELPLLLPLELPLELPLLLPLLLLEPPPEPESAFPFGVPHPVGPSYPVPAVQRYEGLQLPLLPDVTS